MIYKHFVQLWKMDRFQGYDYGVKGNLRLYGTEKPPNMLENYKLIDVPVHFIMVT
jgi:hypothetical protein